MSKKRTSNTGNILSYFECKRVRIPSTTPENAEPESDSVAHVTKSEVEPKKKATSRPTITASSEEQNPVLLTNQTKGYPNDIGHYIGVPLTDQEKVETLGNIWMPDFRYEFPAVGSRNLRFQLKWFSLWSWLAFSDFQQGAFCKYCVLFAPTGAGSGSQPLGQLCKSKFNKWKNAKEIFYIHQATKYHQQCIDEANTLTLIVSGKRKPIEVQLDKERQQQALKNRVKIAPIIETILFCGRQGLSLRGHRDCGPIALEEPDENDGNFRALLRYRGKADDNTKNSLLSSTGNARYTSPTIQNEVIEACNSIILSKMAKQVNEAECFSILADETADISGVEQLSLCVRYVDLPTNSVNEVFLQFAPLKDTTGKGIATTILEELQSYGIVLSKMRGQGYDGAASMSGQFNGVQTHIRSQIPTAIYVHCSAHSLNLAISNACEVPSVRSCLGTVGKVYNFFNTPKRQLVLSSAISEVCPNSEITKLKQLCATRWVERHTSVSSFLELQDAIFSALDDIIEWTDRDSSQQAQQLLCSMKQANFNVALQCTAQVFNYSVRLCKELQKENLDLVEAIYSAEDITAEVRRLRESADDEFKKLYSAVSSLAEKYEFSLNRPRLSAKQAHRCNTPVNSDEEYYRISIYIPFLDAFINHLQARFLNHKSILKGFQCLLPKIPTIPPSEELIKDIKHLVEFYSEDLDCNADMAIAEVQLWYRRLSRLKSENLPGNALEALAVCSPTLQPNVRKLLQILATLPVSTCTSERSFSTLRRLKTYLRNSTGETRLNGLALLNIHRKLTPTTDAVIDELLKKKRRLDFVL